MKKTIKEEDMYNKVFKTIDFLLYNYNLFEEQENFLKDQLDRYDYKSTYRKWLKSKSSTTEDIVIRNIEIENKILKISKWKNLIEEIIKEFKENDELKYKFMCFKYFNKYDSNSIEKVMNITNKEQKNIQNEIRKHIYLIAMNKKLLR